MKYITEIKSKPLSGVETKDLFGINPNSNSRCEFLRIKNALTYEHIINLKVESDYSPTFKQCEVINELVIIGYGNRFSIFDLKSKEIKASLAFDGYFSSFKVNNEDIFIATDSELININFQGNEKWKCVGLGIDGVIISKISETEIFGSGEWDPPGGWESFKLERKTGLKI